MKRRQASIGDFFYASGAAKKSRGTETGVDTDAEEPEAETINVGDVQSQ